MTQQNPPSPALIRALLTNGWGILCFLLFAASLGTAEYKYVCALLSSLLMLWLWFTGLRPLAERYAAAPAGAGLDSLVSRLPMAICAACLGVLALAPLVSGKPAKYLAFVPALLGLRM